jgi:hypothetical protein
MLIKPLRQKVFPHEKETKEKLKWRKQSEKMMKDNVEIDKSKSQSRSTD